MPRAFWGPLGGEKGDGNEDHRESVEEALSPDQQQANWLQQQQAQDDRFEQAAGIQAFKAIWETEQQQASGSDSTKAASRGSVSQTQAAGAQAGRRGQDSSQVYRKTSVEEESPEERRERRRLEGRENVAKRKRADQQLETIADARNFCRGLVDVQLERANEQHAPMNQVIYGDSEARKAIATLLPDPFIRELFLSLVRDHKNWPRMRPLFGTPPYHFLRPEDAGLIRAGGLAVGRTNMTYERANETAAYSQFGAGHLVDSHLREYKVVLLHVASDSDMLPCNVELVPPQRELYMNVRVPKRSRSEKLAILHDVTKRRSALFPAVGEVLTMNYSAGLQSVWGAKTNARLDMKVVVRSVVPRSAKGATAAVVAVKLAA